MKASIRILQDINDLVFTKSKNIQFYVTEGHDGVRHIISY